MHDHMVKVQQICAALLPGWLAVGASLTAASMHRVLCNIELGTTPSLLTAHHNTIRFQALQQRPLKAFCPHPVLLAAPCALLSAQGCGAV
jgi:hypothetical protein